MYCLLDFHFYYSIGHILELNWILDILDILDILHILEFFSLHIFCSMPIEQANGLRKVKDEN